MNTTNRLTHDAALPTTGSTPATLGAPRGTRLASALAGICMAVLLCGAVVAAFQQQGEGAQLAAQASETRLG